MTTGQSLGFAVIAQKSPGEFYPAATAHFANFGWADHYCRVLELSGNYPVGAVQMRYQPPSDPSLRFAVTAQHPSGEYYPAATAHFANFEWADHYRDTLERSGDYPAGTVQMRHLSPPAPDPATDMDTQLDEGLTAAAAAAPALHAHTLNADATTSAAPVDTLDASLQPAAPEPGSQAGP